MIKMRTLASVACLALTLAVPACAAGHAASGASAQHSALKSAEANPTVEAAIAKARKDVVNPCIASTSGITSFVNCAKNKVPPAQRKAVGKCLAKAVLADHKKGDKTYAIEQDLIGVSGPACIAPALP